MKIVMLEPLGVEKEKVMEVAKTLTDAGHEFVFCGAANSEHGGKESACKRC